MACLVSAASWVREFAVQALHDRATDEQLLSYLLPLVQSIQYERALPMPPPDCPLAALLIQRAVANIHLANFLHWCVAWPAAWHGTNRLASPLASLLAS